MWIPTSGVHEYDVGRGELGEQPGHHAWVGGVGVYDVCSRAVVCEVARDHWIAFDRLHLEPGIGEGPGVEPEAAGEVENASGTGGADEVGPMACDDGSGGCLEAVTCQQHAGTGRHAALSREAVQNDLVEGSGGLVGGQAGAPKAGGRSQGITAHLIGEGGGPDPGLVTGRGAEPLGCPEGIDVGSRHGLIVDGAVLALNLTEC